MTQRALDQDTFPYFVTFVVEGRNWVFTYGDLAERLHQTIKNACVIKHFTLYAFCILPDHVHMLVQKSVSRGLENPRSEILLIKPESGFSNPRTLQKDHTLSDLVKSIKGTFSWNKPYYGRFWQPRSYYRIVPSERYLRNVLAYIEKNYQKQSLPKVPYSFPPYVFMDEKAVENLFGTAS